MRELALLNQLFSVQVVQQAEQIEVLYRQVRSHCCATRCSCCSHKQTCCGTLGHTQMHVLQCCTSCCEAQK